MMPRLPRVQLLASFSFWDSPSSQDHMDTRHIHKPPHPLLVFKSYLSFLSRRLSLSRPHLPKTVPEGQHLACGCMPLEKEPLTGSPRQWEKGRVLHRSHKKHRFTQGHCTSFRIS